MQMTPDNWDRAKELFEAALALDASQRTSFLAEKCRDESLRQQVEKLLIDYQEAGSFLDDPVLNPGIPKPNAGPKGQAEEASGARPQSGELLTATSAEAEDPMVGRQLGAYKLVRRVGQGGMAAVFLAVRADDEYRKQVAVKLVQPGLDSRDLLNRFRNERQTLAGLDHPNIVRLLDGGSTSEGLPFLVMDYVEGSPIDEYCDQHKLTVDDRLHLFGKVCEAVRYAHQKLVVHRDLKPSNILVVADGTPKLLDFGIAKVLNAESSGQRLLVTQTGTRCMTPAYASPEQMRGKSVRPATDIYSLGVVLYELLTGHRPYRLTQHTPAEMERAICEQEPETPSTAISRVETDTSSDGRPITKTPESVSQTREGQPDKLRRRLRGDLDNIVLKALQKEPQRRYDSVEEFSRDIGRHLRHLPVRARPNTLTYRVSKFIQRHKTEVGASLIVLLLGVGAALPAFNSWLYLHRRPKLTDKDTIVLADFANSTGDSAFDAALRQALSVQLEQSPFLNILSDQKVADTLRLMGRLPTERVTPELAKEVCVRSGSKVVLEGSISTLKSEYVLGLNATACDTGEMLAKEEAEAESQENILKALSKTASSLRTKLGETLASVQKFDVPFEATTSSLEALKIYSVGRRKALTAGDSVALPFFKRAVELDPDFAAAYVSLAVAYSNLGLRDLADENIKKAYALRVHVSERERYSITANYYDIVNGELEKSIPIYESWAQSYKQDRVPRANLGWIYANLGKFEQSVAQFQASLAVENDVTTQGDLAFDYFALNRLEDGKALLDEARTHMLDNLSLRQATYFLAFLTGNRAEMERQVALAAGRIGEEDIFAFQQSDTEAYYGHLRESRESSGRAIESAIRAGNTTRATLWRAATALREAEFVNVEIARKNLGAVGVSSAGYEASILSALTLARIGDRAGASKLLNRLTRSQPSNTHLKVYWGPSIKAAMEMSVNNATRAIAELGATVPYELAQRFPCALYPPYLRGQAYLLAHNGTAAAVEFQKLLDHRGIVLNFPTGALVHLQLGRAYAISVDTTKARNAYQDFFTIWKDADPEIPILKQAKAEYAMLQ